MTFETKSHGRYQIKSGPLGGGWGANAFRGKVLVVKADGSNRDEAVAKVEQELDRLDAIDLAGCDKEGAPSAEVYERAFSAVLPKVPDSYRAMLKAHLAAPDHRLSATRLAEAAGYSGYEGANLHYGRLGLLIATEINFTPPTREDGTEIWTAAIARDPKSEPEFTDTSLLEALVRSMGTAHFEWQLRPQVVQALHTLGL